mgnify:CR=1 FL=1
MNPDSLFDRLDLNKDGRVSRSELHIAATRMGWQWQEAPILALLDLLTISESITKKQFSVYLQQIANDPMGPYGRVLLNAPDYQAASRPRRNPPFPRQRSGANDVLNKHQRYFEDNVIEGKFKTTLEKRFGTEMANGYAGMIGTLGTYRASTNDAALLIIDPQRSFTQGVWKQSIGIGAATDVEPIEIAFINCARLLKLIYGRMEIMFTRCPFPPGSYDWDERLAGIIDSKQNYFIKPGNSVLFPPLNGFKNWLELCVSKGKGTLIIGGCTLNSCVRVSSIESASYLKNRKLRVVVDLSICGARLRNYLPSPSYEGVSAVESAIRQMTDADVQVVRRVEYI